MKLIRITGKRFYHKQLAEADPRRTMVILRSGPAYLIEFRDTDHYRVEMTRQEAIETANRLLDLAKREQCKPS